MKKGSGNPMKRMISHFTAVALSFFFFLSLTVAIFAADSSQTLTTSYSPENHITFRIEQSEIKAEGVLSEEGMESVWFRIKNGKQMVADETADVAKGQAFSLSLPLKDVRQKMEVSLYLKKTGESSYWSYIWNMVYVEPDGTSWRILQSPVLESNLQYTALWKNPAHCFGDVPASISALSAEIVGDETNDYRKLSLINHWIAENIYYDYDYYYGRSKEIYYEAEEVLLSKRSVCEGYANLTCALIWAQGIPCRRVTTYALGVGSSQTMDANYTAATVPNHVHPEAWVDGRWVIMDPTWDSNNEYQKGVFSYQPPDSIYFDITPELFAMTHKILDEDRVPEKDTPSSWAMEEAKSALSYGLIPASLQSNYHDAITRGEFCTLLVNMLCQKLSCTPDGLPAAAGSNVWISFTDTADENVLIASRLEIVNGVGDGLFVPDRAINRQEAATMLTRAASYLKLYTASSQSAKIAPDKMFSDMNMTADWAKDSVRFVSSLRSGNGYVMNGISETQFGPTELYTREQSILTMYRLYQCEATAYA